MVERLYLVISAKTPDTPSEGITEMEVFVTWNGPDAHSLSTVTYVCTHSTCR